MIAVPVECPKRDDDIPFYTTQESVVDILEGDAEGLTCGFDDHDHTISAEEIRKQFRSDGGKS